MVVVPDDCGEKMVACSGGYWRKGNLLLLLFFFSVFSFLSFIFLSVFLVCFSIVFPFSFFIFPCFFCFLPIIFLYFFSLPLFLYGDPQKMGNISGLGIGSLRDKNKALLFKWLWRFGLEESNIWKNMIKSIYNLQCFKLIPQDTILGAGSTWSRIVNYYVKDNRLQNIINHQSVILVGIDKMIKFWLDTWVDNGSLAY